MNLGEEKQLGEILRVCEKGPAVLAHKSSGSARKWTKKADQRPSSRDLFFFVEQYNSLSISVIIGISSRYAASSLRAILLPLLPPSLA